jgi:FAD/FMN-containing dehydrogenase
MMDKMTKVLSVDKGKKQLRVQAQMNLKDLYATADANDMSTPRSALPWWQGLTLAGVFATSSHGTGNNATSMIVSATPRTRAQCFRDLTCYTPQCVD